MTTPKTIGFISSKPLEDKRNWSGTMYNMYIALKNLGYNIVWLKPADYTKQELCFFNTLQNIYQKIFRRGFNTHQFATKAWLASRKMKKQISTKNIDVLFAPTAIPEITFLKIKQPIIYLNDANVAQLLNYYSYYTGFGWLSKKATYFVERHALRNADAIVYSSDWASDFAHEFYQIPKEKIHTIKFGSNADAPEHINTHKNYSKEITFLFLAVFWERKGGDIALEAIEILRKKGYPVKLQVVGCTPPKTSEAMQVIPFLNKNIPEEAQKVKDLLHNAHFMFIPTKADCTPISFCEAASYGLPIISSNTGGVSAHVEHRKTGLLLPPNATAEDYAMEIEKLLKNTDLIKKLSLNAREKYERELNWEVWKKKFDEIIKNL